jgi:hypothetical protein
VLQKKHLCRPGLVGEARLRVLALLAAERRIHQHHVMQLRRVLKQPAAVCRCHWFFAF